MRFLLDLFLRSILCRNIPHQDHSTEHAIQPYECTYRPADTTEELEKKLDEAIYKNDEMFLSLYPLKHPFTDAQLEAITTLADRYHEFQPQQ